MDGINFNTSHNVLLEYKAADIFERILASVIDIVVLIMYFVVLSLFSIFLFNSDTAFIYIILMVPAIFYDLLFESLWNGQSIGKNVMKIRVIRTDGLEPTFVQYFLRWILRIIDIWISSGGVAILTILLNGRGQRVGDLAAGTTVVSLKNQIQLSDTILTVDDDIYIPEFPEAVNLTEKDISTCKDLLKANKMYEMPSSVIEANYKVKKILEDKMGIKTEKQPLEFISKVVKDYTYYNNLSD
jgi:uncharacterized RDD family membrane protein YckC